MDEIHLSPITSAPARTADDIVTERRQVFDRSRRDLTVALERRRRELERALHDGAQQQLLALRMEILRVVEESDVVDDSDDSWKVAIASVVARLDGALEDLGRLASGQLPRALDAGNLVDSLRQLAAISGATADVHVSPATVVDEASAEVIAYVVSEALANAQQHSNAAHCTVKVASNLGGLLVDVVDDGQGGASIVPGRGIDGLRRRAEALGGTLEVFSDSAGTVVRLQLPQPQSMPGSVGTSSPEPVEEDGPAVSMVRRTLGDVTADLWFWCATAGLDDDRESGTWRGEDGELVDLVSFDREPSDRAQLGSSRPVRVFVGDQALALISSSAEIERLEQMCRENVPVLLDGRETARAATTLRRLREEHERIARRSQSFEDALRRRLTDRPREELLAARGCLTGQDQLRRHLAAEHVANATELLREIVRRLRVPDSDWTSATGTLTTALERIARRARVRIDLDADDLDDENASTVIERVAEEVMLDSPPRADVMVRVRACNRYATLSVGLQRLPSPVAIALLEELALSSGSTLVFRPGPDGVRLMVEVPCES